MSIYYDSCINHKATYIAIYLTSLWPTHAAPILNEGWFVSKFAKVELKKCRRVSKLRGAVSKLGDTKHKNTLLVYRIECSCEIGEV